MDPGIGFVSAGTDRIRGIESAGIYIAGLNADKSQVVEHRQAIGSHAALAIDGNCCEARLAESRKRECLEQGDMNLLTDNDLDFRSAEQAAILDIPTRACEQCVTGGGDSRKI